MSKNLIHGSILLLIFSLCFAPLFASANNSTQFPPQNAVLMIDLPGKGQQKVYQGAEEVPAFNFAGCSLSVYFGIKRDAGTSTGPGNILLKVRRFYLEGKAEQNSPYATQVVLRINKHTMGLVPFSIYQNYYNLSLHFALLDQFHALNRINTNSKQFLFDEDSNKAATRATNVYSYTGVASQGTWIPATIDFRPDGCEYGGAFGAIELTFIDLGLPSDDQKPYRWILRDSSH